MMTTPQWTRPQNGDDFVWMSDEGEDFSGEFVFQVADVIGLVGEGCWLVEYATLGASGYTGDMSFMNQPRTDECVIEFDSKRGRWRNIHDKPSPRARGTQ